MLCDLEQFTVDSLILSIVKLLYFYKFNGNKCNYTYINQKTIARSIMLSASQNPMINRQDLISYQTEGGILVYTCGKIDVVTLVSTLLSAVCP